MKELYKKCKKVLVESNILDRAPKNFVEPSFECAIVMYCASAQYTGFSKSVQFLSAEKGVTHGRV